jgi:hypothetical protein
MDDRPWRRWEEAAGVRDVRKAVIGRMGPGSRGRGPRGLAPATVAPAGCYARMLTARDTMSPIVTSETRACTPIVPLAGGDRGIVSVGEKAVALVSET